VLYPAKQDFWLLCTRNLYLRPPSPQDDHKSPACLQWEPAVVLRFASVGSLPKKLVICHLYPIETRLFDISNCQKPAGLGACKQLKSESPKCVVISTCTQYKQVSAPSVSHSAVSDRLYKMPSWTTRVVLPHHYLRCDGAQRLIACCFQIFQEDICT
jgi:hypothetical protein